MSDWMRVTRSNPCAVCGGADWCTRSADGAVAMCMRIESPREARGGGWIHRTSAGPLRLPPVQATMPVADWSRKAREMFEHQAARHARWQLAEHLGVDAVALERLGVGVSPDGSFTSWPERDATGRTIGIVRRYPDGTKKHMSGGNAGLYIPRDWNSAAGPILLPEGGSDTAALLTMGLCAIGRPSCTGGVALLTELLKRHLERAVVVLGENDRKPERLGMISQCAPDCDGCSWCWPGKYGAQTTATKLCLALHRAVHWRMVVGAKDAREWLQLYGRDGAQFLQTLRRQRLQVAV